MTLALIISGENQFGDLSNPAASVLAEVFIVNMTSLSKKVF